MANQQTPKSRYPSRYSPGKFVSADQYIVELVCEHKAQIDHKDLPVRFWKDQQWAKFFRFQMKYCRKLVAQYGEKAVLRLITSKRGERICALHAPFVEALVEQESNKLDAENIRQQEHEETHPKVIKHFGNFDVPKKSVFSDLED